jgi:hypothetical protein
MIECSLNSIIHHSMEWLCVLTRNVVACFETWRNGCNVALCFIVQHVKHKKGVILQPDDAQLEADVMAPPTWSKHEAACEGASTSFDAPCHIDTGRQASVER